MSFLSSAQFNTVVKNWIKDLQRGGSSWENNYETYFDEADWNAIRMGEQENRERRRRGRQDNNRNQGRRSQRKQHVQDQIDMRAYIDREFGDVGIGDYDILVAADDSSYTVRYFDEETGEYSLPQTYLAGRKNRRGPSKVVRTEEIKKAFEKTAAERREKMYENISFREKIEPIEKLLTDAGFTKHAIELLVYEIDDKASNYAANSSAGPFPYLDNEFKSIQLYIEDEKNENGKVSLENQEELVKRITGKERDNYGDNLFKRIQNTLPNSQKNKTGKITGMFLEGLNVAQLNKLKHDNAFLKKQIKNATNIIRKARIQEVGEGLFVKIQKVLPETNKNRAGKITGMILELPEPEIQTLLEDNKALEEKTKEALNILVEDERLKKEFITKFDDLQKRLKKISKRAERQENESLEKLKEMTKIISLVSPNDLNYSKIQQFLKTARSAIVFIKRTNVEIKAYIDKGFDRHVKDSIDTLVTTDEASRILDEGENLYDKIPSINRLIKTIDDNLETAHIIKQKVLLKREREGRANAETKEEIEKREIREINMGQRKESLELKVRELINKIKSAEKRLDETEKRLSKINKVPKKGKKHVAYINNKDAVPRLQSQIQELVEKKQDVENELRTIQAELQLGGRKVIKPRQRKSRIVRIKKKTTKKTTKKKDGRLGPHKHNGHTHKTNKAKKACTRKQ